MRTNSAVRLLVAALLGCTDSVLAAPTPVAIPDDAVGTGIVSAVWGAVPTGGVACIPQNEGETSCGTICCASSQSCAAEGQCVAKDSSELTVTGIIGGNGSGQTLITTINGVVTTEYLAPFRPTATASATATSTGDSDESNDDGDDDGGSSLSAGGIVGIVFGTLIGIAILGALCFFCFARGLWASVFGGRTNNSHGSNSNIEVYEEYHSDSDYYSRGGASAMAAGAGRRRGRGDSWHGEKPRKKKSGAGWLGLGAVAATLLAMLNMKKDKKASRESEAMYNRPYGSERSSSTGVRTRRSRSGAPTASRSGVSNATHTTRVTRSSSRTHRSSHVHDPRRVRSTRSHSRHSYSDSRSGSRSSSRSRSRSPEPSRRSHSRSQSHSHTNSRSHTNSHRSRSRSRHSRR